MQPIGKRHPAIEERRLARGAEAPPGVRQEVSRLLDGIVVSPTVRITPRIDGADLRGGHFDAGVTPGAR